MPSTRPAISTSSLVKGSRSNKGCLTCRRRKKKCDEEFNSVGWCRACVKGRYLCTGRPGAVSAPTQSHPHSQAHAQFKSASHTVALNDLRFNTQLPAPTSSESWKLTDTYSCMEVLMSENVPFQSSVVSSAQKGIIEPASLLSNMDPLPNQQRSEATSLSELLQEPTKLSVDAPPAQQRLYRTPSARWTDLIEKYQEFNRGFIRYLPKSVRLKVMEYMSDIAATNDLGRSAGSAVALMPFWDKPNDVDESLENEEPNMISKAVSAIMQAKMLLGDLPNPLEATLAALLDMYYYEFWQNGARAAYTILDLMLATIAGKPEAERTIDLRSMANPSAFTIHAVACLDIIASACLADRRPFFDIVNTPGRQANTDNDAESNISNTYMGLPVTVLRCFAAISVLRSELNSLSPSSIHGRAQAIEQELVDWIPQPLDREASTPESPLEHLAVQEMWRYVVHHSGCLSLVIRNAVSEIMNHGRLLHLRLSYSGHALDFVSACLRACPWMFAASVAINQDDRDACRIGLQRCGGAQAFKDDLVIAEMMWDLMDTTGYQVDWRNLPDLPGQFPILV